MPNRKAQIGSISHGTLLPEDLLEAFTAELDYLDGPNNKTLLGEAMSVVIALASDDGADPELVGSLIEELSDALNDLAPPYCYFGTHEGDGSDFGFWPCMDAIEELPRLNDPEFLPVGEDCTYVNDHGNVTVYGADGSILLELV